MEDSQLHVISMEFKKKPYCTFLFRREKRATDEKKVHKWGERKTAAWNLIKPRTLC